MTVKFDFSWSNICPSFELCQMLLLFVFFNVFSCFLLECQTETPHRFLSWLLQDYQTQTIVNSFLYLNQSQFFYCLEQHEALKYAQTFCKSTEKVIALDTSVVMNQFRTATPFTRWVWSKNDSSVFNIKLRFLIFPCTWACRTHFVLWRIQLQSGLMFGVFPVCLPQPSGRSLLPNAHLPGTWHKAGLCVWRETSGGEDSSGKNHVWDVVIWCCGWTRCSVCVLAAEEACRGSRPEPSTVHGSRCALM